MPKPRVKRFADGPELRRWAFELTDDEKKSLGIEGIEISEKGRFHSDLVRAFNRAHKQDGVMYVPIGRTQPRINSVFEEAMEKVEDDKPEVYRQPRQPRQEPAKDEREVPPTPQPLAPNVVAAQPTMLAFPAAPEQVMDMIRNGATVIVAYVALPVQVAV